MSGAASGDRRPGFSLPVVMFAIVLLGVLVAGVGLASTQDNRVSRNGVLEQRAFGVAEAGMGQALAQWGVGGTTAAPSLTNNGDTVQLVVTTAMGDKAQVTVTRLTSSSYAIISSGRAGSGSRNGAERRLSMAMRYTKPAIQIRGALTSYGSVSVKGSATVSGQDNLPTGWNAECASYPAKDTSAIAYAPGSSVSIQKASAVTGAAVSDPVAGDLTTYDQFGDQSWTSLVSGADITLPGDLNPYPDGTMTTCNTANQSNWGEPDRVSLFQGCAAYFPVIYSPRNLHLNSSARGQGILLVDGDLQINGSLAFYGIIIVRGSLTFNGTGDIWGTVLSREATLTSTNSILGNADIHYSSCAAQRALTASAIFRPSGKRSWAPLN